MLVYLCVVTLHLEVGKKLDVKLLIPFSLYKERLGFLQLLSKFSTSVKYFKHRPVRKLSHSI